MSGSLKRLSYYGREYIAIGINYGCSFRLYEEQFGKQHSCTIVEEKLLQSTGIIPDWNIIRDDFFLSCGLVFWPGINHIGNPALGICFCFFVMLKTEYHIIGIPISGICNPSHMFGNIESVGYSKDSMYCRFCWKLIPASFGEMAQLGWF